MVTFQRLLRSGPFVRFLNFARKVQCMLSHQEGFCLTVLLLNLLSFIPSLWKSKNISIRDEKYPLQCVSARKKFHYFFRFSYRHVQFNRVNPGRGKGERQILKKFIYMQMRFVCFFPQLASISWNRIGAYCPCNDCNNKTTIAWPSGCDNNSKRLILILITVYAHNMSVICVHTAKLN